MLQVIRHFLSCHLERALHHPIQALGVSLLSPELEETTIVSVGLTPTTGSGFVGHRVSFEAPPKPRTTTSDLPAFEHGRHDQTRQATD
jgi:hypothetical protein